MPSKKNFVIWGLCLTTVFSLIAILENRDRSQVLFERLDPNIYVTSDLPKLLYANSLENTHTDFFSFFQRSSTYECLNGKNPSQLTQKEQLIEFIKGPCLPVVAVPGLLATRLTVKIDCETFQTNNPDIFSSCGWSTCSSWQVWASKPKDEYTLWVSDFLGPVSILFNSTVKCWANIIQLNYDFNQPDITKRYTSPIGTNVTVYKDKDDTKSQCGFEAVNDILPGPYQTLYSKGFGGIQNTLVDMGYQLGLTLFATPYDWRKTTLANGITGVLNETLRRVNALTGKPAILMAHSLGNFGALHFLNSLSKEEKDKYIANYVSITNPLAGSPKALKTFIGGDQDYVYKKYGINFYAQRKLIQDSSGAFDLIPKDPYTFFADSTWLQEWKSRSTLENTYDVKTQAGRDVWEKVVDSGNYTYKWFPHPLLNCSFGFEQRRDECGLYMYNWSHVPIATVMNKSYTADQTQLTSFFDEYALATNATNELFNDTRTNGIYMLINPEVPVTLVYGSHLYTDKSYEWDYDPRIHARQDQFAFANTTLYSQGDQTVPTSSALLPALKWSWEFDNKDTSGVPNAHPVKTVEICSIYNNKGNIYDNMPSNSPFSVQKNEYIGLQCDCFDKKNTHPVLGQSCDHADILNDSKFLAFIANIVNGNYKLADTNNLLVNTLSDQDIKLLSQSCPSVDSDFILLDQLAKTANVQPSLRPETQ